MNEQKFRAKEQELIDYENKVYVQVLDFLKLYNEELRKQGVEIACFKEYMYPDEETEAEQMPDCRYPIQREKRYVGLILLLFRYIGGRDDNEDGKGYFLDCEVTEYGIFSYLFFKKICQFRKYGIKSLLKKIDNEVNKIKSNGFHKQLEKYTC